MGFVELLNNIGLLLALGICYDFLRNKWPSDTRVGQLLGGLLFGGVTVVGMLNPWHLAPGLIFDGRSIVISLVGLFGGVITATLAGLIAVGYRLWLGGPGMVMGVSVIASSALLGIGYGRLRRTRPHLMKVRYFFLFGLIVHLVMLLMTFTIPQPLGLSVLRKIWLPVMLIYPVGTFLMASLLHGQELRHLAIAALGKSEKGFRNLVETMQEGLGVQDEKGRITLVNDRFCRMLGYNREEVLGRKVTEFLDDENREKLARQMAKRRNGFVDHYEITYTRRDGTPLHTIMAPAAVQDEKGRFRGFFAVITDITDRIRMEHDLRKSVIRYRQLFENTPNGVAVYRVEEKGEDFMFVDFNRTAEKIEGIKRNTIVGKKVTEVFPGVRDMGLFEVFQRVWSTGKPEFYPMHVYSDDRVGESWRENWVYRLPEGELVTVYSDVTERKRAEAELEKYRWRLEEQVKERTAQLDERVTEVEKLNRALTNMLEELDQSNRSLKRTTRDLHSANQELEAFSYSVSHDLRAPLRAINGFATILSRRHSQELDEEGIHYLENVIEASLQMGRLIDDLLHYSRTGRKSVRTQPVSLERILADILMHFEARMEETGAEIHVPGSLPEVKADPTLLGEVLTNLLDNALTYRKLEEPCEIRIAIEDKDQHVILSVADNGIGIAPEFQEKVFNMFQRLHSQDEYPGTGIGLAIVKKSMEMIGGKVWLESLPGKGTTFYLELKKN